jgi:hypothetical protein
MRKRKLNRERLCAWVNVNQIFSLKCELLHLTLLYVDYLDRDGFFQTNYGIRAIEYGILQRPDRVAKTQ